ncbi:dephospho-CoA kinase [Peribacillus saganii]|uniref:Dephospho-CoA kinase n=1 Tax=Peribacillus saganii TaxID=2303992 RepID=A0A372LRQ0_9BACI|nr:dephospho-CoA kinase [Peribacillus saganii]RFU70726.1 dephospho-CoA kinase [Peribacillus saganii]
MGIVYGITGGIASGKSTVSKFISDELGFSVIDADIASRKAVEPGMKANQKIAETFGKQILLHDGSIDREQLGALIFHDKEKRLILNSIVHPAVREYMLQQQEEAFSRGERVVFLDIPLLFESKLTHLVAKTMLIYTDENVQLLRLMERNNLTESEARARINSQMPLAEKKQFADEIVNNNGTITETKQQVINILKKWRVISQ